MKDITLLYVEDEVSTRQNHIVFLKSNYGFNIFEADNGAEALEIYKKHKPDIVLTDITMPKMSGLELIKEIRKISHHTKIVVITAHSEQDKLMQALGLDVINYLVKPIDRKKLIDSVDIAIETMSALEKPNDDFLFLAKNAKFDMANNEYYFDDEEVKLSKSECQLLKLLIKSRNRDVSSFDIFVEIWDDLDREYSSESVRTLIKKLRKKLPDGVLENIYGGFYKLKIH